MEGDKGKPPSILIVDDEPINIKLLHEILEKEYRILYATRGLDALNIARSQHPDLILLDVMMPEMSGHDVCRQLKADPDLQNIPVFFVTALSSDEDETLGLELGADDYISKPIRPSLVKARVRNRLRIKLAEEKVIRAYKKLKSSEVRLRSTLDNALDAILTMDENCSIMEFNPAAEELFGCRGEDAIGRNVADFLNPLSGETLTRQLNFCEGSKVIKHRMELPGRRADGEIIDLDVGWTAFSLHGQMIYTAFLKDITAHKQLLKSLRETLEVAESSGKTKSEFLANMSHEIRSPMNAIMGMTDLVLNTPMDEKTMRKNLTMVQNASESLLEIINGILDLSKIDADRLELETVLFDLRQLVEDVCELMAIRAHPKGVEMCLEIASDFPEWLQGDPLRIRQILTNLISNAIKFTEVGEIVVSLTWHRITATDGGGQTVEIAVSDTGVGIAKAHQAEIFDPFKQVDSSSTRKFGGTGLGLSICKGLVSLMKGKIGVESEEGRGSVFRVSLDFPAPLERKKERASPPLAQVEILLVGDESTGGRIMAEMLRDLGAQVQKKSLLMPGDAPLAHGKEGLYVVDQQILKHVLDGFPPIPGKGPWFDKGVLLVPSMGLDVNPMAGLWFKRYELLKKPATRHGILQAVQRLLDRPDREKMENRPPVLAERSIPPQEILLVEDLPNNVLVARTVLEQVGHRVTVASDGQEALDCLAGHSFDLVLMDIHMPIMDGIEATKRIRAEAYKAIRQERLPIVAVTARAIMGEEKQWLEVGMDGYVHKPYRPKVLLDAVARYAYPPPPPPVRVEEEEPRELDAKGQEFLREWPAHATTLERALESQDEIELAREVGWLKQATMGVGWRRLSATVIRFRGHVEMDAWDAALDSLGKIKQMVGKLSHLTNGGE